MTRQWCALCVVLLCSLVWGQRIPPRVPLRPVPLRVRLFDADTNRPLQVQVTVRLLDGFGTPVEEKMTLGDGEIHFRPVLPGIYQVRVFNPNVVESFSQFEILDIETSHMEQVRVRVKMGEDCPRGETQQGSKPAGLDPIGPPCTPNSAQGGPTRSGSGPGMVSAARLQVPKKAEKEFSKGSEAMQRSDWTEARKRLEAAIALYPQYDQALNSLGVVCVNSGDEAAARQAFEKAIEFNPHNAGALRNLARILLAQKKYAEAEDLLTKSLAVEPLNASALAFAAYAEFETGRFDEALANARKVHTVPHEGLANAHLIAARVLESRTAHAQAAAEYRMYLKESPDGPNASVARAALGRLANPK